MAPITTVETLNHSSTDDQWQAAMDVCDRRYDHEYGTHWIARPDILYVAHDDEGPVATAGLELGSLRPQLDTERYFELTPSMRTFINAHRASVAEFGRFTCDPRANVVGAQAVLRAALRTCRSMSIQYLFAWARPEVSIHGARRLGVPFWTLDVPLDEQTIRTCPNWAEPPITFFFGRSRPRLLLAVVPFFDYVLDRLDNLPDLVVA